MKLLSCSVFLLFSMVCLAKAGVVMDSVGVEKVAGKTYILHKVDPKETLFGLGKRYGVSAEDIKKSNAGLAEGLKIGATIRIPYKGKLQANNTASSENNKIHVVEAGETLFKVSKDYGVSVEEIKKWNGLQSDNLDLGQKLIVGKVAVTNPTTNNAAITSEPGIYHVVVAGEGLYSIARKYGVSVDEIKKLNNLEGDNIGLGQKLLVKQSGGNEDVATQEEDPVKEDPVKVDNNKQVDVPNVTPTVQVDNSGGFDLITEKGLATVIEGSDDTRKYLALHRTAKPGTILKIRNQMNNQQVFVRVLGKLPQNAGNDKYVLKISKAAYDRLGAIDQFFRVEITYTK